MNVSLNLVSDPDLLENKGDAWPYYNEKLGYYQLAIVCPKCGKQSASAGRHKFEHKTLSYSPSIIHAPALGGCGYHGWLRNGVFTD